ncbi:hypothetical protein BH11CYA1_BH11CYA1_10040 [soil metagenome]
MRAPRAAAGGTGDGPPSGFRAGENLWCRVVEAEPGGYSVTILKTNQAGFIKTTAELEVSFNFLAEFVCIHKNRVLLAPIFGKTPGQNMEY